MNNDFQISTPSVSLASQGAAKGGVLTTRTSSKTFQSVGAGGTGIVGSNGSYSVKKTASFTAIHKDISQSISYEWAPVSLPVQLSEGGESGRGDNPGGPVVGDQTVPVGDMLLPLLAMAAAYIIVKLFRNRKTSQAL